MNKHDKQDKTQQHTKITFNHKLLEKNLQTPKKIFFLKYQVPQNHYK